jgi:hypothetical protein
MDEKRGAFEPPFFYLSGCGFLKNIVLAEDIDIAINRELISGNSVISPRFPQTLV